MDPVPLRLTPREQNILAALMERLADVVYALNHDKPVSETEVFDKVFDWVDLGRIRSQELGTLYDKFHRTGHNS